MPKLYGNKPIQVHAEGDDIDDIIPFDDIEVVCEGDPGETDSSLHTGEVSEEKAGTVTTGVVEDKLVTEIPGEGLNTNTAESRLLEEKAGVLPNDLALGDPVTEGVAGIIDKITADDKPSEEKAGVIEVDIIDDLLPVEKAGTISTTIAPENVC